MKLKINALSNSKIFDRLKMPHVSIGGAKSVSQKLEIMSFAAKSLLCVVLGLVCSFLVCSFAASYAAGRAMTVQSRLADAVSRKQASAFAIASAPKGTISFEPFGVVDKSPKEEHEKKEAKPIDSFTLVGTVPPAAAWINVEGATSMVMRDQEFNGYVLAEVDAGSVLFKLDEEEYRLYLYFSNRPQTAVKRPQQQKPQEGGRSDVQNAEFNGGDGVVSRELLHSLLMNPYEELGKLRLIPTNAGMVVDAMRSDSLLHQLGVKQGDEITGINSISIKDVPSIMNAINSMMSGARLDFDVTRNNERGKLGYVVK